MGKGKGPSSDNGSEHISRPLTTLKDPSQFGPPPKNVNYHGGAALPNQITPHRGGLGAPLIQEEIHATEHAAEHATEHATRAQAQQEEEAEAEAKRAAPPLPYRADTTGLKTSHLPPPPVHRAILEGTTSQTAGNVQAPTKAKPSIPPRLPARKESYDTNGPIQMIDTTEEPPPPSYNAVVEKPLPVNGGLNQGAMNRLGKAGVSVPSLGIGESNPWKAERSSSHTSTSVASPTPTPAPQLSELQARFSRMNSGSPKPEKPAEGTTVEQKQAALKTAQNFHKDPSTVTLADAQSAASTANNFRARHQDQISAGAQKANNWNKKFNVTGRMNNFLEKQVSPASEQPPAPVVQPVASPAPSDVSALSSRKPPPPPPPKKPSGMHAPPPVPLGTKPSFG